MHATQDNSSEDATRPPPSTFENTIARPTEYAATPIPPPSAATLRNGSSRASTNAQDSGASQHQSLSTQSNSLSVQRMWMEDVRHEAMVNYLFQKQCSLMWVGDGSGEVEGIVLRKSRGNYLACPSQLVDSPFGLACRDLDVCVAMTVNSRIIKTFLKWSPDAINIPLRNGLQVQVLPTMSDLANARKNQFAAFIACEGLLVAWDDDATNLISRAQEIEKQLTELVWGNGQSMVENDDEGMNKKEGFPGTAEYAFDHETAEYKEKRPIHLMNAFMVSLTIMLLMVMIAAGVRTLLVASLTDKNWVRFACLAFIPLQVFFALFFANVVVGCFIQILGPVKQMRQNSKYYSALLPRRVRGPHFPHVTIQMPVYKESLASVIAPTVKSVKQAMSTYELQGGSANLFVNDDGLQLLGPDEREARITFYADHNIGWTARPKHGADGFVRAGKFKKASNMNYGLALSTKVEEKLDQVERGASWTQHDEAAAYAQCLQQVLDDDGRAWADGNIRIGDYILLVDSDTRVPSDCLLDGVSEMENSPQVGILQFSSGVMQVVRTYFENGITFFTNLIYSAIRYTTSNGDIAPFVGHNAILRWSALQQVSFADDDGGGGEKFWSESHVSEDFDMALRLQCDGYIIRLAAWAGDGFKEGVSLTVYDELARWAKYAYGCNELLFHPLRYWPTRGPLTPLFRKFMSSSMPLTTKVSTCAYIGTYYAISAAWVLTMANYFAVGWFNGYLDKYYIDSWRIWFSVVVVFNGVGNVALAALRHRSGERPFLAALVENFKWTLMLCIFFGGLSLHVSQAILAHMLGIDMAWGATAKEAELSNFFLEVPKVLRRFKITIAFSLAAIALMVVLGVGGGGQRAALWGLIPREWMVTDFVAIMPMATVAVSHLLLPIALNPALMTFSW